MLDRVPNMCTDDLFSPQYTFKSFLKGGSKKLRCISLRIETALKSVDGTTTEQYKNKQRECIYEDVKQWCGAAGIDDETVLDRGCLCYTGSVRTTVVCTLH